MFKPLLPWGLWKVSERRRSKNRVQLDPEVDVYIAMFCIPVFILQYLDNVIVTPCFRRYSVVNVVSGKIPASSRLTREHQFRIKL